MRIIHRLIAHVAELRARGDGDAVRTILAGLDERATREVIEGAERVVVERAALDEIARTAPPRPAPGEGFAVRVEHHPAPAPGEGREAFGVRVEHHPAPAPGEGFAVRVEHHPALMSDKTVEISDAYEDGDQAVEDSQA